MPDPPSSDDGRLCQKRISVKLMKAPGNYDAKAVMHHFSRSRFPSSASRSTVRGSDRWVLPGPLPDRGRTRFFVHACTANGYVEQRSAGAFRRDGYRVRSVRTRWHEELENRSPRHRACTPCRNCGCWWITSAIIEEFREDARSGSSPISSLHRAALFTILHLLNVRRSTACCHAGGTA